MPSIDHDHPRNNSDRGLLRIACGRLPYCPWRAVARHTRAIETDYSKLTMTFQQDGVPRIFQGISQKGIGVLTKKDYHYIHDIGYFSHLLAIEDPSQTGAHPTDLEQILMDFSSVFLSPTAVPLHRAHDHRISCNLMPIL